MKLAKSILLSTIALFTIQSYADYPSTGLILNGTILPNGAFPSHVADFGYGGWHTSTNASSIPAYLRAPGTAVWNPDTETLVVFSGTSGVWEEIISVESAALWDEMAVTAGIANTELYGLLTAADTVLSNALVDADTNLQAQITSNDDELVITDTRVTAISNSVYGESFWSDPINSDWVATVDVAPRISYEFPKEKWYIYNTSLQYVNAEEQLVLKVRDGAGDVAGYTSGAAFILPPSYFSDGAGEYQLLFKIEGYENTSSRLTVKVSEANEGSGGTEHYYIVRTHRIDTNYGQPLLIDTSGDATTKILVEKIYNSIDHSAGSFYKLDFTYDGVDDVVIQFGAASIDNNISRGVIINDIIMPQKDLTHMLRTDNPHAVTKAQVGLGSVDNTSDIDKPVSTAQILINDFHELEIFGDVFYYDTINTEWDSFVDSTGVRMDYEQPKGEWFSCSDSLQYINAEEQLVLKVSNVEETLGNTTGAGIVLPSSYFNGSGVYNLSVKIAEFLTDDSLLTVKVSGANDGSGGTTNYYTVRTQYTGTSDYGHQLMVSTANEAVASTLVEKTFDPENYDVGFAHLLNFTYNGIDDVVLQFGGAGNNDNPLNGVVIDDIYVTQGGTDYIKYHVARSDNPHDVNKYDVDMDITESLIEKTFHVPTYYSKLFTYWNPVNGGIPWNIPTTAERGTWYGYYEDLNGVNDDKELFLKTDWTGDTVGVAVSIPAANFTGSGTYQLRFLLKEYLKPYSILKLSIVGANAGGVGTNDYYTLNTHATREEYLNVTTVSNATATILAQATFNKNVAESRNYYTVDFDYDQLSGDDIVLLLGVYTAVTNAPITDYGVIIDDLKIKGVFSFDDALKANVDASNVIAEDTFRLNIGLGTASTNSAEFFVQSSLIDQNSGVAGLDETGHINTNVIPNIIVIFTGGAR